MRFLVDNQLPVALAHFLASRGEDCDHVLDLGLAQANDAVIWRCAGQRNMVVISKDEDFFHFAMVPGASAQLVWVRLGNCRTLPLLSAFERAWPRVRACLEAGDRVVELR